MGEKDKMWSTSSGNSFVDGGMDGGTASAPCNIDRKQARKRQARTRRWWQVRGWLIRCGRSCLGTCLAWPSLGAAHDTVSDPVPFVWRDSGRPSEDCPHFLHAGSILEKLISKFWGV